VQTLRAMAERATRRRREQGVAFATGPGRAAQAPAREGVRLAARPPFETLLAPASCGPASLLMPYFCKCDSQFHKNGISALSPSSKTLSPEGDDQS
jgi:hypothetical protein